MNEGHLDRKAFCVWQIAPHAVKVGGITRSFTRRLVFGCAPA